MRRNLMLAAGTILVGALVFAAHLFRDRTDCGRAADLERCASAALEETASREGIAPAFALMRRYLELRPGGALCHTYVHAIGAGTFRALEHGMPVVADMETSACGYGFYHGLLEAFLISGASPDRAVTLCRSLDARSGQDAPRQCFHGIGHGIMADPDLASPLSARVADTLGTCEDLAADPDLRIACASGVMNALALAYTGGLAEIEDPDRPFAACASIPAAYQEVCYANMNVLVAKLAHNDMARALDLVRSAPLDRQVLATRLVAAYFASFMGDDARELSALSTTCSVRPSSLRTACREGIVHGLLESAWKTDGHERAFAFCRGLEEDDRSCMSYALKYLPSIRRPEEVAGICRAAGAHYADLCPSVTNPL